MRNIILGFAGLVATTSLAHADTAVQAEPTMYVAGGAMVGAEQNLEMGGLVEGGYRLGRTPLWLHGQLTAGQTVKLFTEGTGGIVQLRVGAEARECVQNGRACAIAGVDLGHESASWSGQSSNAFEANGMTASSQASRFIAVPHIGLDFGGRLRYRPAIEGVLDGSGIAGFAATGAVAYQW